MGVCTSHELDVRVVNVDPPIVNPKPFIKRESDMNLVPGDAMPTRMFYTDEVGRCSSSSSTIVFKSEYEREKFMLVAATNSAHDLPGKMFVVDVDVHSKDYGQIISQIALTKNGDEFLYTNWTRCSGFANQVSKTIRNYVVIPCFNTSRLYIIGIDDILQMRIAKTVELADLGYKDTSMPLYIQSCPGRGAAVFFSCLGDKHGSAKGTLQKLDRRLFTIASENSDELRPDMTSFGGTFALHIPENFIVSTEWGIFSHIQHGIKWDNEEKIYGNTLNVWTLKDRQIKQRIELPELDGQFPICVRFIHNPELIHAFVITAIGGSIFHLHRNSITDVFTARKAYQFPIAHVSGWIREEVPAIPVDLVISMDDQYLYVSCWLQGFVAQFNITDPFNITLTHKIFIGGIIHNDVRLIRISTINFMPERRRVRQKLVEGGPARIQLSLDGRRLYVANSFIRAWDEQIYPQLSNAGGVITLVHINVGGAGAMHFDDSFGIEMKREDGGYLPREMRFMNGDCTCDCFE
ncbi:unnamed protein product [Bursaphelenchus okinawaensis]|uniref:Methanethiol oxidase n=1 Tax=Bursaphelenchus okinawaensis TaxID=465554 RepID=A0A811KXM2_9BILA|nr:unnamed protein product [Bursaphelenchus okinawaensis]CAG9112717.1 unnamed protein product [Bursaphelenchus okinawaensis]